MPGVKSKKNATCASEYTKNRRLDNDVHDKEKKKNAKHLEKLLSNTEYRKKKLISEKYLERKLENVLRNFEKFSFQIKMRTKSQRKLCPKDQKIYFGRKRKKPTYKNE